MKTPVKIIGFLAFLLPFAPAQSQNVENPVEFIRGFQELQMDYPMERVFVHTDRQWYVPGDYIWFSAYLTAGPANVLSGLSSVLYVELFDGDERIDHFTVKLVNGRGNGQLEIPEDVEAPSTLKLRAYTAWMLNFGEGAWFEKQIPVSGFFKEVLDDTNPIEFDVQFHPEGGSLVDGIESRVGVKIIGSDGKGLNKTGRVLDNLGNQVAGFEASHLGMGVFDLTPEPGRSHIAEVDGKTFGLPNARPSGAVLSVDGEGSGSFRVSVRTSAGLEGQDFVVFAHVRGAVFYAQALTGNRDGITLEIPEGTFPTGVVHFTLLDEKGYPVAERLAFSDNKSDRAGADIALSRETYGPRESVYYQLNVRDANGSRVPFTASISIFDDRLMAYSPNETCIRTALLLESDIRGFVENPGHYFSGDENASAHLDLLLLNQGWRMYDMEMVYERKRPEIAYFVEDGFIISGTVKTNLRRRPVADASVAVSVGVDEDQMILSDTDESGRFYAPNLEISGTEPVNVRANDSRGRDNVIIELDPLERVSAGKPGKTVPATDELLSADWLMGADEGSEERIQQHQEDIRNHIFAEFQVELDEIVVTAERLEPEHRELEYGSGGDHRLREDELERFGGGSILAVLNLLPGVNAQQSGISVRTSFSSFSGTPSPIILVDNISTDYESVLQLSVSDIESIEVFRRTANLTIFGASGAGGVISIKTKRGISTFRDFRGFISVYMQGYHTASSFYSPRYGFNPNATEAGRDNRITVHWEPMVFSADGLSQGDLFYTPDRRSSYRMVVQGITADGVPFTVMKVFSVE